MTRPRPGIGSELLPVMLILICLAGTWCLVVAMHRKGARTVEDKTTAPMAVAQVETPVVPIPSPPAVDRPPTPRPPAPPEVDPTEEALGKIASAQAEQVREAQAADRKAEALESARHAALADTQRWRRREALVRSQVDALTEKATRLSASLEEIVLERDVLARERDAAKAALAKARTRSSYAVLPHKGPNGTWRRPIILECKNGEVTIQPNGPSFSMLDLSSLFSTRSSPIVAAVAREVVRAQSVSSPDGTPVVPYIFFVVRPDGIRPYYNARGQLEPLGIAFGYELVDQNMEIDYPDLNNLDEWDGTGAPRPGGASALAAGTADRPWPVSPPTAGGARASDNPADSFVWPARPTVSGPGSGQGRGESFDPSGDPSEDPIGRGSRSIARNGLGRGGSGVDPVPLGIPIVDPDNPYDTPGAPGLMPGSPGGGLPRHGHAPGSPGPGSGQPEPGDAPRFGQPRGPTGPSAGYPGSVEATAPGQIPRLIPVNPEGMPGLEDPGVRPSDPSSRGGWRAAVRDADPASGVASNSAGGTGMSQSPQDSARPTAGGASVSAIPGLAGSGNFAPNRAGLPASSGRGNFDVSSQGAPPPLSQLARLAGATGAAGQIGATSATGASGAVGTAGATGAAGESGASGSPSRLQSGTPPLGIQVPQSSSNMGEGADENDSGQPGSRMPGSRSRSDHKGPLTVEVPFEMVVACGPDGVVIHPGGYRLSSKSLKSADGLLLKDLKTIVRTRRQVDPSIHPHPSIRFLVEPGGGETYRDARRQTVMSGLDWPVSLQVSDSDILDTFTPREPL